MEELSLSEIDKMFEALKALGVTYVSIGGGEPLLRDDLPKIVETLIKKGLKIRLLTNGILINELTLNRLIGLGLRDFSISLDTLNPETQAYIHNGVEAWQKITDNIRLIAESVKDKKGLTLINTVVSRLNIDELDKLHDFAKESGCFISFIPVECGESSEFAFSVRDHETLDRSYEKLIVIKGISGNHIFNSTLFLSKSRDYLKNKKRNWTCHAGRLYYSINPKGDLSGCHRLPSLFSFRNFNSIDKETLRRINLDQKNLVKDCGGCMRPCWSELSLVSSDIKSFFELAKLHITS